MGFGISLRVQMRRMVTLGAYLGKHYSFLRLVGVTMIMDILKGLILTIAKQ